MKKSMWSVILYGILAGLLGAVLSLINNMLGKLIPDPLPGLIAGIIVFLYYLTTLTEIEKRNEVKKNDFLRHTKV